MNNAIKITLLSQIAIFAFSASANAAGFFLQEQSASGAGTSYAGQVASPRDASILFYNPAGMTALNGAQINVGTHLLFPNAKITNNNSTIDANPLAPVVTVPLTGNNGGNPYHPTLIPNFSLAYPVAETDLWLGLNVSTPFGLKNKYNDGWFGRYDSTKTELLTLNISPSAAYKINNWLSVGGGLDYQYAYANLEQTVSAVTEGNSKLEGDDKSLGYNVGFMIEPTDTTTLGIHYRSAMKHTLEGRITVTGTGSTAVDRNLPGTVALDLPDILQLGFNQKVTNKISVMGGATWFGWDNFDAITVISQTGTQITSTAQNYKDTWAFGIGGEYAYNDKVTLRAGYQYDPTPTTDEYRTSRTPDGDRNWFAAGATYQATDKISIDFGATYINVEKGSISVDRNIPTAIADVNANTDGHVGILSLGVNYKF